MNPFEFTAETEEGATFTPWTDGWAVGYKITARGQQDRWLVLNPSQTDDLSETNAFVYLEASDPALAGLHNSVSYYTIWG